MRHRTRAQRIAILAFLVFPLCLAFFGLLIWGVMALWNGLMPEIFGLRAVTYWQMLGLMLLSWVLFGGLRGARGSRGGWERGMRRRWERMTPEEREEFRRGLRSRCGDAVPPETQPSSPPSGQS
jgi:hypothetical protein